MGIVLDASIALAWCFKDEITEESNAILLELNTTPAYVPEIWSLEVSNILLSAEKRKRIHYADITRFIGLLNALNIHFDRETHSRAFHDILVLAHSEGLTTYDSAYLELAMRRGFPLASKDKQLCNIAKKLGVKVIY